MYVRKSSKKRKYLIVKLLGTSSSDRSLYVFRCRCSGCINRWDVLIKTGEAIEHVDHAFGISVTLRTLYTSSPTSRTARGTSLSTTVPIATAAVHPSGEPCRIYLGRPSRRRSDGLTR
jgi:hypothetical protein